MKKSGQARNSDKRQWLRLAKLLSMKTERGLALERVSDRFVVTVKNRRHSFPIELVDDMVAHREIEHVRNKIRLTGAGLLELKNRLGLSFDESRCGADPDTRSVSPAAASGRAVKNQNESPLARLYNRKLPTGKSYITEAQLQAGEKLRMDFERAQLQPRMTASYECVPGSPGNRNSGASGSDLSDFAMDCRQRVNEAVELLGPELAGVALDICCFLKGLERVERERQ